MAAPMSLSGQPSVADMEKVIREFYQGPQAGNPQLQQYLRAFQLSQASWSMVWEFLDPNKTTEVQFFAATTLHVKISHFWHEVSGAEREQMLKRLLELSKTYLNLPHGGVMFNRLSMSMGNLCLHLLAEGDDSSVDRVFAEASNLGEKALLELLIVLPDEANAPCFVTFKKQAVLKNGLLRYGPRVLSLLSNALSGSSVPSISPLRCLVSWVRLGLALEQTEPLWPALFSAVKNPNLAQSALEACQSLLTQPGNEQ
ncbi:unnamed protein product [Cyprideis torosa]|uniref:Uncharacterized protein n=1 Tax=Cyprideis torosa TaxID=163714 RepID=A0A7R8ZR49_9CRUS|nr:unnamed protein product [Cyprideis torosa]CAG0902835.1 unnamed protein product [Cyprideis torosa]